MSGSRQPDASDLWIFGYGSLVWRPAFPHVEQHPAHIVGWKRRFWQGSPDHRGTPEAPGRVVTLVPEPGARCWDMGYCVDRQVFETVLADLDHREKAGYERHRVALHLGDRDVADALFYVGTRDNPSFLGPAPLDEMAAHIRRSHGPSGTNAEYLFRLAEALRAMGTPDPHVTELEAAVRRLDHLTPG